MKFQNLIERNALKAYLAVASFVFAIIFAFTGMFCDPRGIVDNSVLILIAQLLILCATMLGLRVDISKRDGEFHTGAESK